MAYLDFDHKQIDKLLNNRLRLAILAAAAHSDETDFTSLKQAVQASDGNLSTQLRMLEDAGYLVVNRTSAGNRPQSLIALTNKGQVALARYRSLMDGWLQFD